MARRARRKLLFDGSEWDFDTLRKTYDAINDVAVNDLGLDIYPNQIEIISSEQMLDAYSSIGMPLMYRHWSYGKHFVRDEKMYRKGFAGLAYEIVINSNPCISYNMEENTMPMQALVMAHAAFGHNHFFKNNYLFKQWTDAEGILDYLNFAKNYVAKCEESHGFDAVEETLDAAHALMDHSVFRYRRPPKLNLKEQQAKERERRDYEERTFSDIWRTLPKHGNNEKDIAAEEIEKQKRKLNLPQENLLYMIESHSPILEDWQREIIRIVRNISQYFYPQKQTKIMNEGCATFVHYYILNTLYDRGQITEGAMLEIIHSHSNVVAQPDFDDPRYRGLNPYALGFSMMRDIRRICTDPTAEDRDWFPDIAGCQDWRSALKDAWANYRDESFIRQFLSPNLMREMRMFVLTDDPEESHFTVGPIHDERGFEELRRTVAHSFDLSIREPDIQVVDVDLLGDRQLVLHHVVRNGIPLDEKDRDQVLRHIRRLWGYGVTLIGISDKSGETVYETKLAA